MTAPIAKSASSTAVIAMRLRIVALSAAELVVTVVSRPYIDASRTPSPPGATTTTTATIAPIAAAAEERDRRERRRSADCPDQEVEGGAADQPGAAVEDEQPAH